MIAQPVCDVVEHDELAVIAQTVFFKFTSFNLRQMQEELLENVPAYPYTITGQALGLLTPAHATYRPTSNPLTGHDAGSTATINIASFSMRIPGIADIPLNSGSITGLNYNTLYYVYYDDPGFKGGTVVYEATTTRETALNGAGRFFVGSITTPVQGSADTVGNADGGAGAQVGVYAPVGLIATVAASAGNGAVSNLNHATDADVTVATKLTASAAGGVDNSIRVRWTIPSGVTFSKGVINVIYGMQNSNNPGGGGCFLQYSLDGGVSFFVAIASVTTPPGSGSGPTIQPSTFQIPLPPNQNPANVIVQGLVDSPSGASSGSVELDVFQAWLQVLE